MHIVVVCCELVPREELAGHVFCRARGDIGRRGMRRGVWGVFGSSWKGGWAWNGGVKSSTRDEERWRAL